MKIKKLTVLILAAMMLLTLVACGGKNKNSDVGYYIITSMTSEGETFDEEMMKQMGLYGTSYIELKEDKTGVLCLYGEDETFTWEPGVITADGESVNYTLEDDVLTLEFDVDTLIFTRSEKGADGDTGGGKTDSDGADSGKIGGSKKDDDETSDDDGVVSKIGGKTNGNTDPMVLGDYVVQYKDACLMEDWDGEDAIVIIVDYTNNSENEEAYNYSVENTAYQNGMIIPMGVIYTNEELYETITDGGGEYAEPGETVEVCIAYTLSDPSAEVEVEFGEWLGDSVTSITIDPSTLEKRDVDSFTGGSSGSSGGRVKRGSSGDELLDFWNGDWYGWWAMTGGCYGAYEDMSGQWWDACGVIDIGDDYTGTVEIWDGTGDRDNLICSVDVSLNSAGVGEYGTLMSEDGLFVRDEVGHADWIVDPGLSNYDNLIYIEGSYEDEDGEFDYVICLRHWGVRWDDMEPEDLPYSYEDWYLPLIEWGSSMPDAIDN